MSNLWQNGCVPASDHIQPFQMKLFMQAKELMDTPSDEAWGKTLNDAHDLREAKLDEANMDWDEYDDVHGLIFNPLPGEENLRDSIAKRGVRNPVKVRLHKDDVWGWTPRLTNGNHRVVAAHDVDPEMYIPVSYTDRHFSRSSRDYND